MRFPPVMSRRQLEKSGYLKSFPHFLGCVCCLNGAEAEDQGRGRALRGRRRLDDRRCRRPISSSRPPPVIRFIRWSRAAARCRPQGLMFDVAGDCFRREPSKDLDRLQSFRMREYVCLGTPEQVDDFRRRWMAAGAGFRRPIGTALSHRAGKRRVLRARRQADGDEPDRAGVEIRAAGSGALGGAADGVHELQLSPRPFRHGLEPAQCGRRRWCIPAASPSASIAWRWRCSRRMVSNMAALARVRVAAKRWRMLRRKPKLPTPRVRYRRGRRGADAAGP